MVNKRKVVLIHLSAVILEIYLNRNLDVSKELM